MTLYADPDHWYLLNNPIISVIGPKGSLVDVNPFKRTESPPHPLLRPDAQVVFRPRPRLGKGVMVPQVTPPNFSLSTTPVASQLGKTQIQPPTAAPQIQLPSKCGTQLPSTPASVLQSNCAIPRHTSPPQPSLVPVSQNYNGTNGAIPTPAPQNGVAPLPQSEFIPKAVDNGISVHPNSQNGTTQSQIRPIALVTGYHPPTTNATPTLANLPSCQRYPNGLSSQQMQQLHTIFSGMPPHEFAAFQAGYGIPASYDLNLKLPPSARQMQWINDSMQPQSSAVDGVDGQGSPNPSQGPPM